MSQALERNPQEQKHDRRATMRRDGKQFVSANILYLPLGR
jgi:hypothetical protein